MPLEGNLRDVRVALRRMGATADDRIHVMDGQAVRKPPAYTPRFPAGSSVKGDGTKVRIDLMRAPADGTGRAERGGAEEHVRAEADRLPARVVVAVMLWQTRLNTFGPARWRTRCWLRVHRARRAERHPLGSGVT